MPGVHFCSSSTASVSMLLFSVSLFSLLISLVRAKPVLNPVDAAHAAYEASFDPLRELKTTSLQTLLTFLAKPYKQQQNPELVYDKLKFFVSFQFTSLNDNTLTYFEKLRGPISNSATYIHAVINEFNEKSESRLFWSLLNSILTKQVVNNSLLQEKKVLSFFLKNLFQFLQIPFKDIVKVPSDDSLSQQPKQPADSKIKTFFNWEKDTVEEFLYHFARIEQDISSKLIKKLETSMSSNASYKLNHRELQNTTRMSINITNSLFANDFIAMKDTFVMINLLLSLVPPSEQKSFIEGIDSIVPTDNCLIPYFNVPDYIEKYFKIQDIDKFIWEGEITYAKIMQHSRKNIKKQFKFLLDDSKKFIRNTLKHSKNLSREVAKVTPLSPKSSLRESILKKIQEKNYSGITLKEWIISLKCYGTVDERASYFESFNGSVWFYYKADCMEHFMSCLMDLIEKDNLFTI